MLLFSFFHLSESFLSPILVTMIHYFGVVYTRSFEPTDRDRIINNERFAYYSTTTSGPHDAFVLKDQK